MVYFGVRGQAKRDTALDFEEITIDPKRRRRFALPAHSKCVERSGFHVEGVRCNGQG
jgi:hypothetical protein